MAEPESRLARDPGSRLLLGGISLFLSVVFGLMVLALIFTPMPPLGTPYTILLFATEELLLATAVFGGLGVIWAVAMPAWVERLYWSAWKKLLWAILLGAAPIVVMLVLAAFGVKLGAGPAPR